MLLIFTSNSTNWKFYSWGKSKLDTQDYLTKVQAREAQERDRGLKRVQQENQARYCHQCRHWRAVPTEIGHARQQDQVVQEQNSDPRKKFGSDRVRFREREGDGSLLARVHNQGAKGGDHQRQGESSRQEQIAEKCACSVPGCPRLAQWSRAVLPRGTWADQGGDP